MGLPFKNSLTSDSIARHFSSVQLTKSIFNGSQSTPFDIGTDQILSGFQSGKFEVINENTSLYNNNGGFNIRKTGVYKIEFCLRTLTSAYNPHISIKVNGTIVNIITICCFNSNIVGTSTVSMNFTGISKLLELNINDVITFSTTIDSTTLSIVGDPTLAISYINILEI
jgi:hypothetical protein